MLRFISVPSFSTPVGRLLVPPFLVSLLFLLGLPVKGHGLGVESQLQNLVTDYCVSCHNPEKKKGKLDKVGVQLDSFGDSNGKIDELFEPLSV